VKASENIWGRKSDVIIFRPHGNENVLDQDLYGKKRKD
jgi:hypothetical protein